MQTNLQKTIVLGLTMGVLAFLDNPANCAGQGRGRPGRRRILRRFFRRR